jgi:hypothetical protein
MEDAEFWEKQFETTQGILGPCPPEIHKHVGEKIRPYATKFSPQERNLWERFVSSHPILQRLIYYTYSPPEAIEFRNEMLRIKTKIEIQPTEATKSRKKKRPKTDNKKMLLETDILDEAWYIQGVLSEAELKEPSLVRDFLDTMNFDFDRVTAADNLKRRGREESIEELRNLAFRGTVYEDKHGCRITKIVIDESPAYRDEVIARRHPDGTLEPEEYHTYLGEEVPEVRRFPSSRRRYSATSRWVDETLVRWMQFFEDVEPLRESAYSSEDRVYVHDKTGRVIEEIPSALEPKYRPLREKLHRANPLERKAYRRIVDPEDPRAVRYEPEQIDRRWDLEQEFRKAIMQWEGTQPLAGYFKTVLRRGILNLGKSYRERFMRYPTDQDTIRLIEDLDFTGGSLNEAVRDEDGHKTEWIALLDDEADDRVEEIDAARFIDQLLASFDKPVEKLIAFDFLEARVHDDKPSTNVELAQWLSKQGKQVSPQYIGRLRPKVIARVEHFLASCK